MTKKQIVCRFYLSKVFIYQTRAKEKREKITLDNMNKSEIRIFRENKTEKIKALI